MSTEARILMIITAAFGALAGGCLEQGPAAHDRASAAFQDDRSYYFVFQGDRLFEVNDARGPCRQYGGCTFSSTETLDLRMLGLSAEEEGQLRNEARVGRVVFYGKAHLVVYVPPTTTEAGVPALVSVEHAWRATTGLTSRAPLYGVSRPLPSGMASGNPWYEPYLGARLNTQEHGSFSEVRDVAPEVLADVSHRGGLLVQGTVVQVPDETDATGQRTVSELQVEEIYRRWTPSSCPAAEQAP